MVIDRLQVVVPLPLREGGPSAVAVLHPQPPSSPPILEQPGMKQHKTELVTVSDFKWKWCRDVGELTGGRAP